MMTMFVQSIYVLPPKFNFVSQKQKHVDRKPRCIRLVTTIDAKIVWVQLYRILMVTE